MSVDVVSKADDCSGKRRLATLVAVSLFKSASIVSSLTLVSRITGLVRELLIASTFGASALTDAFNVAFRIPNLFRRLFAEGAFSQAFVPVLAASRQQAGDEATHVLIHQVTTVLAWALFVASVAGVLGAPWLVWAMASGLQQTPQGFEAAVVMTRWMFPYIALMSLVALGAGVLNTWKRFAVPAATPVLLNVCMIGAALWGAPLFGRWGIEPIYAMAGGVMLGGVALLVFSPALVAVLYHYGAFNAHDVQQTTVALMGYGVGLIGLVAIKVLAPGFYASQDTRTPVIIAVSVLVITQLLNVVLVPVFAHAGLALSIGLGALINAGWLLIGLRRRGSYVPNKGWWRLIAQVSLGSVLLGAWLATMTYALNWTDMQVTPFLRIGSMAGVLLVSALIYFVTLRLSGLNVINLLRR